MAKSTKTEVQHRVHTLYKLIAEGNSRQSILQYGTDTWGVTERQVETYYARAQELCMQDADMERPAWIAQALVRLQNYENAAFKQKQNQTAINSVQAQAKLIGIDL